MCEVASRRVARKRGVAVETPEAKITDGVLVVNLTYVDDGRVLDTPEDLSSAFEHAIQTEVALKGYDMAVEIVLSCMKDGQVTTIGAEAEEDDEEMFACEVCDGLVKESDPKCPHCGAVFEDEEEEEVVEQTRKGPPGLLDPPTWTFSRSRTSRHLRKADLRGYQRVDHPDQRKEDLRGLPRAPPGPKKGGPPGSSKGAPPGPKKGGPPGSSKGTSRAFQRREDPDQRKVDLQGLPKADLQDQRKVDLQDLPKKGDLQDQRKVDLQKVDLLAKTWPPK